MSDTTSSKLQTAIDAAKKGANEALRYFDKNIEVVFKDDNTPVTIADRKSEETIKNYILSKFPDAKFLAEESGGEVSESGTWIIDPVDGTRSFSRGVPGWCVLIAYYEKGEFLIGVCYFPVQDELLYAEKGKGAFMNGKKVCVSKIEKLNKAYIGFGNPKYMKDQQVLLDYINASASARSWEATYCEFLLAQGKIDALVDGYAQLWDIAPFVVIIEEAGGKITRLDGSPIGLTKRGCIVTNGLIHNEVLKIINN